MTIRNLVVAFLFIAVLPAAELPVRTVVLYKHGVGYFERTGTLGPGESARLDFKAGEMNDVLKSLTINEQGGKVTGLRYDSSVPLDQKLTEFPFRINNGEPLSAVIDQLKGARIEMEFGPQKTGGAIVSARLIAVSSATRDDLLRYYRLPAAKVSVVWSGVDSHFFGITRAPQNVERAKL